MIIDERIEALTQSVELLSHMHQDNEKRYTAMFERLSDQQGRILTVVEQLSLVAADYGKRI